MPRASKVGRSEMELLEFVHGRGAVTVGEAAIHFASVRGHARTTVLNMMTRLWRKKFLTRRRVGGVFRYSPRVPRRQLLRGMVGDFVSHVLGGSVSPFVAYLAEQTELSDDDRRQLAALLRQLEKQGDA